MKYFAFLILAIASNCPALAHDITKPTLVVPKTSGLYLSVATHDPIEKASFSGQVWVSGLLIAQWPADLKLLEPSDKIEVSIKLDKKEIARLPYYDWPENKRKYIPNTIHIINPEEAVILVFPKELSLRLLNKKLQLVKVHAKFLLSNYQIGVECDAVWAHANLLAAAVKEVAQTSNETDLSGC